MRRRARAVSAALLVGLGGTACAAERTTSVVGIAVEGCRPNGATGTGVVVDADVILTSAHVLRGADSIRVDWPDGTSNPATIIGFDPEMDLAYLETPTDEAAATPVRSAHVGDGDTGEALVVRDGEVVRLDVVIERSVRIDTEDIYLDGSTRRPGWDLEAAIVPGDSGGPVIVDGAVVGILWARSNQVSRQSYAIDPSRAGGRIERQRADRTLGPDIDLARCE